MIRDMARVYIVYTREQQDELVARLQKLGALHIERTPLEPPTVDTDRETEGAQENASEAGQAPGRQEVENLLVKARGVLDLFHEVDPELLEVSPQQWEDFPTRLEDLSRAFREELDPLEGRLTSLVSQRRELRDRRETIGRFREVMEASEGLLERLPREEGTLLPRIGEDRGSETMAEIEATLGEQIPGRYRLAWRELSEDRVLVLVRVDPEYEEAVDEYLDAKGLRHLALPTQVSHLDFEAGVRSLRSQQGSIPERLEGLEEELRRMGEEHAARMVALVWALENRLAQLGASERFGYTAYAFLVSGWVPQDELEGFRSALAREFPGIIINEDPAEVSHEEIPVSYQERAWARPYQLFLSVFQTPKHGSIDPIPYISVFFPILFAIVVGDFGYGLVILALALWGLRGFPGVGFRLLQRLSEADMGRSALTVMKHGGAFSILMGLVFGEFFGLELEQLGIPGWGPWPYSRLHNPVGLLVFTVGVGAVQVVMGLVFGMMTALRLGNRKHLAAKAGLLSSLIAFSLLIGYLMGIAPPGALLPGIAFLALALPLMAYGGGATVMLEALTPFIHVLSYARIMGFAVAAVALAVLINSFVSWLGTIGNLVVGAIMGGIVALVLHTLNLLLHIFEGTIQSARLQWVEFFEKFLLEEFGGTPYRPFQEVDVAAARGERRP